jgi:hypothetical protein
MLHSKEAKNTLKHSLLKSSSQMLEARSGIVKQDGNTTAIQQSRQMNRRTNPNKRTTNSTFENKPSQLKCKIKEQMQKTTNKSNSRHKQGQNRTILPQKLVKMLQILQGLRRQIACIKTLRIGSRILPRRRAMPRLGALELHEKIH